MTNASKPTLRIATYNVRACVGTDRKRSESRIAAVIASTSADIVGLQEVDLGRTRSAAADQAQLIAQELGWHHLFHSAMRHEVGHYGDAIVSRYPLHTQRTAELPGHAPWYCRETRGIAWVETETPLGSVHIINTHFGLGRGERLEQAKLLTGEQWLRTHDEREPLVLLGDFNSLPGSRTYRTIAEHLRDARSLVQPQRVLRTFPTSFPSLAVDHIFINAALHATSIAVHRTPLARIASDHFPLVADLVRS